MTTVADRLAALGVPDGDASQKERRAGKKGPVAVPSKPAASATKSNLLADFVIKPIPKLHLVRPEERQARMEGLEGFKAQISSVMTDLVTFLRGVARLTPEEQVAYREPENEAIGQIADYLNRPAPAGVVALVAYADAMVMTCPDVKPMVVRTVEELERVRFIKQVSSGRKEAIRVFDNSFVIMEDIERVDGATRVLEALGALVGRTVAAGRQFFQESMEKLHAAEGNPLVSDEIETGLNGRRILTVPDQDITVRGEARHYRGGPLLVEVVDGYVSVIGGAGVMRRMAEKFAGLSFPVEQLGKERFDLGQGLSEEERKVMFLMHRLLRLGIAEARKEEERQVYSARKEAEREEAKEKFRMTVEADRETIKARAKLTPTEGLIAKAHGLFAMERWGSKFDRRTGRKDSTGKPITEPVWYPMALMERNAEEQIRVAYAPDRLKGFFAPFTQFADPGEDYGNLGVLGVLLRRETQKAEAEASGDERVVAKETAARVKKAAEEARAAKQVEDARVLAAQLLAGSGEELTESDTVPMVPAAGDKPVETRGAKRPAAERRKGSRSKAA